MGVYTLAISNSNPTPLGPTPLGPTPLGLTPLGLYIHIPWCPTRCIYCDFNTYIEAEAELKSRYHNALRREIAEAGATLNHPRADTIFFGGGTPTTLAPTKLIELVDTVKTQFDLSPQAEISTEANPGSLTLDYLREVRQSGINRLSLGVQSFIDTELTFLSRLHTADTARQTVTLARQAGFTNINLDLIFNLPQQTLPQWQYNLQEALTLEPDHFSIYSLIIEPGTPLQHYIDQGLVPDPDNDVAADMYAVTIDILGEAGYIQYEISNWAKVSTSLKSWQTPALASAHNLIYWRNQPYLGLGAGAFGTVNGQRWANVKHPQSYLNKAQSGRGLGLAKDKSTFEAIDKTTQMLEQMMLGLRLVREGVSDATFKTRFGVSLLEQYPQAINQGLEKGLLEWIDTLTDTRLRLTKAGVFLANQVVLEFM